MFKRVEIWVLYLLLVFFLIFSILYGALLRHHYTGGSQFKQILPIATFFAEIPHNLKALTFVENEIATIEDLPEYVEVVDEEQLKNGKPTNSSVISKTKFFTPRTGLISIPSYDGDSKSAYIAIYDLDDFSLIHKFRVNARNVLKSANKRQKTDAAPIRFTFQDPILLEDGGVIAIGAGALLELDVCGEVLSVNRNATYHHSLSF